jgi:hypothetical protein
MLDTHDEKSFVLSFSRDATLLMTRTLLLQRTGCTVMGATNLQEYRALLLSRPFDLILICQSVSADECGLAAQFAKEYAPSARLLLMFTRIGKCVIDQADVLLDAHAGPKVFVETAQRMLSHSVGNSL